MMGKKLNKLFQRLKNKGLHIEFLGIINFSRRGQLWRSLFFNKVAGCKPTTLLKRDSLQRRPSY